MVKSHRVRVEDGLIDGLQDSIGEERLDELGLIVSHPHEHGMTSLVS